MKTHLTLCLQAWNADASHTQNLAKLAWLRRPRLCFSFGELFASALRRGLRHGCVSPSPCSFRSLRDWDALPFNLNLSVEDAVLAGRADNDWTKSQSDNTPSR